MCQWYSCQCDVNRNGNLHENCLLISFDVVNMFPSIDNKMGIESVKNIWLNSGDIIPPAQCIIETLELCLKCNNSICNNQHYLQVDDTAEGVHMSSFCNDTAMYSYDLKVLSYVPAVKCWKRFLDDVHVLWEYSRDGLDNIISFMNSIDLFKQT